MKDNNELFERYSKNKSDIGLRNKIVLNNINLVPYTINHYNLFIDGVHNYEEMLQDGYIALIKAVESFDYSLGLSSHLMLLNVYYHLQGVGLIIIRIYL